MVDELRADSVVGCQPPTTGRGAWKAAQRAAGIATQQELRPPKTGQRRPPLGFENHRDTVQWLRELRLAGESSRRDLPTGAGTRDGWRRCPVTLSEPPTRPRGNWLEVVGQHN
ncbi:MAG: hypothetical protein WCK86_21535 [Planctomycetia bacterium]